VAIVKYRVLPGQTLMDAVLMATGSMDALLDVAEANGVSITDDVPVDTELEIPGVTVVDATTVQQLKERRIVAATK
jgi:hypothetical protein